MGFIEVKDLKVHYPIRGGFFNTVQDNVFAVDGVDLEIESGKTYGLVGESGSGKKTIGRAIIGLVTDSPFQGIFSWEFYEDAYDAEIMQFGFDSLFGTDDDFQIDDSGKATLALDQENNKATITLKEGLKWSDGEPLTAEDVIYSYEVIGHPDYTGIRYDGTFQNVVGMEEYHSGEADTISGITQVDDVTVEIEF